MEQIIKFEQNTIKKKMIAMSLFMVFGVFITLSVLFAETDWLSIGILFIVGLGICLSSGSAIILCFEHYQKDEEWVVFTQTHLKHRGREFLYEEIKGTVWIYDSLYVTLKSGEEYQIHTHLFLGKKGLDQLFQNLEHYIKG